MSETAVIMQLPVNLTKVVDVLYQHYCWWKEDPTTQRCVIYTTMVEMTAVVINNTSIMKIVKDTIKLRYRVAHSENKK